MKIKICGITNLEDALLCESLGVDALGFIFYEKSKRFIDYEDANKIIKQLSAFTIKVGVFVNTESAIINTVSKQVGLNLIQLHGNETPNQIEELFLPVIKAFRINNDFDFNILKLYKNCHYLLDTFSSTEFGGTGITFNWNLIPQNIKHKIILSGGISSANISTVFAEVNPYAIDVSSSLEEFPGKKDHKKVKEFFNKIKGIL
jgi:phosphoribosylanthranilate isomerase